MASTRSKTRLRECNTAEESTIADSGLSVVRRATSPRASERCQRHRPSLRRARCHVPRPYRRAQPKPARAPPHIRMEWEAAEEARCDTETGRRNTARTEDSARRVEAWIEEPPPVVTSSTPPPDQAGIPQREGVADDAARTTLPDRGATGLSGETKYRRMSPTSCKLKTRRHHGSLERSWSARAAGRRSAEEVKVMSELTDSGREINDFAIDAQLRGRTTKR
ncbi:hypothetical protein EVAR_89716_1 [Eumeta japonica]|uniref:Uncharacterized protein n=1 Tax=Eumeta variegata TaxID=151549 RepID=A0A4C1Y6D9_EUMVA|nr:hypothetical protein EVAR_89716_1 [Eumeta japonica]